MIRATAAPDGAVMTLNASVNGPVVYLDNWAICDLAEGDVLRRDRFIRVVRSGFELLFSVTNAAELSGLKGRSAELAKEFLNELGPHWFPAKIDPIEVIEGENRGETLGGACIDREFLKMYTAELIRQCSGVVVFSDDFYRLGPLVDLLGSQWVSISRNSADFDAALKIKLTEIHGRYKRDRQGFHRTFRSLPFSASHPALFAMHNLVRALALEGGAVKKGDGLDLFHVVVGSAYSSLAALDKNWKRRIDALPKPNRLARIYSALELDQMVAEMEPWLAQRGAP